MHALNLQLLRPTIGLNYYLQAFTHHKKSITALPLNLL